VRTWNISAAASPIRLATGLWLVSLCLGLAGPLAAQGPHQFKGLDGCVRCHAQPGLLDKLDLVQMTEAKTWLEQDKHAKAFSLLKGELGERIGKALSIPDVSEDQRCLSCHSNWQAGADKPPYYDLGVTCESCHGASSDWLGPHAETAWRGKSRQEKERLGMIDVREPLGRAQQCFSCHIGNPQQGKVLTHAMYAAGHPPLPSIELESFAEQMPPHWRNLRERGPFELRDEFLKANSTSGSAPLAELPRTKGVVIGGVLATQHSAKLLAEQTASAKDGPDLAAFDCGACHHDLRAKSWRQARGYGGRAPGRPAVPVWPTALLRAGLAHVAAGDKTRFEKESAQLDSQLGDLYRAAAARPFGDSEKISAASKVLDQALEALAGELAKTEFNEAAARRVLLALCETPAGDYPDYHSARQIAWGIKTIYIELAAGYPSLDDQVPAQESREARRAREEEYVRQLVAWRGGKREDARKEIDDLFQRLDVSTKLYLSLPAGQKYQIRESLPNSLKLMADYDAVEFRAQLGKLKVELERSLK
jgi:hypothetical protein